MPAAASQAPPLATGEAHAYTLKLAGWPLDLLAEDVERTRRAATEVIGAATPTAIDPATPIALETVIADTVELLGRLPGDLPADARAALVERARHAARFAVGLAVVKHAMKVGDKTTGRLACSWTGLHCLEPVRLEF